MISLSKKIKEKKTEENNNQRKRPLIRDQLLLKEVQEMERQMPETCCVLYANPNEFYRFELHITPSEDSFWFGGKFRFAVEVPHEYNILVSVGSLPVLSFASYSTLSQLIYQFNPKPPHVKCLTRIWHPNITEDGDICLSLLRESSIDGLGWAPTRTLKDVVWGLNSLFTDLLNFDDPLNDEAADHYMRDRESFQNKVREYVHKYAKS